MFSKEFLALIESAQEGMKKERELKAFLESEKEKEARAYNEKLREEKRAEEGALRFFESWKPSSQPIEGLKSASPNDPIVKVNMGPYEKRITDE